MHLVDVLQYHTLEGPTNIFVEDNDDSSMSLINSFFLQSAAIENPALLVTWLYITILLKQDWCDSKSFSCLPLDTTSQKGHVVHKLWWTRRIAKAAAVVVEKAMQKTAVATSSSSFRAFFFYYFFLVSSRDWQICPVSFLPQNGTKDRKVKILDNIMPKEGRKLGVLGRFEECGKFNMAWAHSQSHSTFFYVKSFCLFKKRPSSSLSTSSKEATYIHYYSTACIASTTTTLSISFNSKPPFLRTPKAPWKQRWMDGDQRPATKEIWPWPLFTQWNGFL